MRKTLFSSLCLASFLILGCEEPDPPPPPDPTPADATHPVIVFKRFFYGNEERVTIFFMNDQLSRAYWKNMRVTTPDTSFHDHYNHVYYGEGDYSIFDFRRYDYPPDSSVRFEFAEPTLGRFTLSMDAPKVASPFEFDRPPEKWLQEIEKDTASTSGITLQWNPNMGANLCRFTLSAMGQSSGPSITLLQDVASITISRGADSGRFSEVLNAGIKMGYLDFAAQGLNVLDTAWGGISMHDTVWGESRGVSAEAPILMEGNWLLYCEFEAVKNGEVVRFRPDSIPVAFSQNGLAVTAPAPLSAEGTVKEHVLTVTGAFIRNDSAVTRQTLSTQKLRGPNPSLAGALSGEVMVKFLGSNAFEKVAIENGTFRLERAP